MTRITRYAPVAIGVIAVVACAWFLIGIRQVHAINAATTLLNDAATERSPAVQQHARSQLDAAAFLHPGVDVPLLRAQLAENVRDYAGAARSVDEAIAAEPDNIATWVAYLKLRLVDPSFGNGKLVFARLHELDPMDVYTH